MAESAFDPEHPYYDAKSTADIPKWCKVRVSFRRKFPELVKLKELQKFAKDGGILENLQTLRQSRLSVSKVSKKEWDFILSLAGGEDEDDEEVAENAVVQAASGHDAGPVDPSSFTAGEGGVGDDSALTDIWTAVNGTSGVANGTVAAET